MLKSKLLQVRFQIRSRSKVQLRQTPKINIFEVTFLKEGKQSINLADSTNTICIQIDGMSIINGKNIPSRHVALLDRNGRHLSIEGKKGSRLLVLNAEPIDEPIFQYGPFVMNTKEEVIQAFYDFEAGKMGDLKNFK